MTKPVLDTAFLAGGCFWCLEAVFQELKGVCTVVSGYMGGSLKAPTYEQVCSGVSGHAELVRVEFDFSVISFREILEIFFAIHDPTQLNRQGNDVGSQYRSAIFFASDAQHIEASSLIEEMRRDNWFVRPVVTQVLPASQFFPAEAAHQNYYRRNPGQAYCAMVVAPKLQKIRASFSTYLKPFGGAEGGVV